MGSVPLGVTVCLPIASVVARFGTVEDGTGCDFALSIVRQHTAASLQQAVGHVLNKSVRKTATRHPIIDEMRYGQLPNAPPGFKGIMLSSERARIDLQSQAAAFVFLMRGDSTSFQTRWFPSRSSKSHSRRRHAPPGASAHAPSGP